MSAMSQAKLFDRYGLPAKHDPPATKDARSEQLPSAPRAASTQLLGRKRRPRAGRHDRHDMHPNSMATYREEATAGRLSKRYSEILEIVRRLGQGTDREILQASEYRDMNAVRPRITELIESGWLEEFDNVQDKTTGKPVRVVRIAGRAHSPATATTARRQESETTPSLCESAATAPRLAPGPAIFAGCAGTGIIRIDQNPDRYEWHDIATGESCTAAEKLRATNPHEVEESNAAALKTHQLSSPAPTPSAGRQNRTDEVRL